MTDAKELAKELAGGFIEFSDTLLSKSLKDNLKEIEDDPRTGNVLNIYEAAEAARIIFTKAYQTHHRLMSVANNVRLDDA